MRINREQQSTPAHCGWYVFILVGVAIYPTKCMPCVPFCLHVSVKGPEASITHLCIHYLPRWQRYRVIAHEDGVGVYHWERSSWSKITAETEHVVPLTAGPDKLSPSVTDAIVSCNGDSTGSKWFACHRCGGVLSRALFPLKLFTSHPQGCDGVDANTGRLMWFNNLLNKIRVMPGQQSCSDRGPCAVSYRKPAPASTW